MTHHQDIPSILEGRFQQSKLYGFLRGLEPWTESDDAYLAAKWGKIKAVKIAVALGRSVAACQDRACKLGVRSELADKARGSGFLGAEFYNQVLADFASMPTSAIARKHGVKTSAAKNWVRRAKEYAAKGKV